MLVSRLSSADHALCANALQLINSLMRDSITGSEEDWPKFIQRLQDLGVIRGVYVLMQGTALQDLAQPLLEFQSLTKVLLKKWRDVHVNLEKSDHRRALKGFHLASNPEKPEETDDATSKKHNPHKWRRLGFETESPQWEFQEMGYLGMMDLTDYIRKHQDEFQKMLLEQSTRPTTQRCPIARASMAVTAVLYDHFEVDKTDLDDSKSYLVMESRSNPDKLFKPVLLHWSRLHVAGLHAFFRLWKATGAEQEDLLRIAELIRILIESVVGGASRTKDIQDIEEEIADFEYQRLRELQMELLELTYEDAWGSHLLQVRDELHNEALQFVKEQRIRCLLQGAWFPTESVGEDPNRTVQLWRCVQLSHNRRYLHYADFESVPQEHPDLEGLPYKSTSSVLPSSKYRANTSSRPQHRLLRRLQRLRLRLVLRVNHQKPQTGILLLLLHENHHPRLLLRSEPPANRLLLQTALAQPLSQQSQRRRRGLRHTERHFHFHFPFDRREGSRTSDAAPAVAQHRVGVAGRAAAAPEPAAHHVRDEQNDQPAQRLRVEDQAVECEV